MRAHEFIAENVDDSTATGLGSKKAGGKLSSMHHDAIPGLKTMPNLPSHYYDMYRLGVHMAGSPDAQKMDARSPIANQMAVMAYSPEEHEIINNSAKALGINLQSLSDDHSSESKDTNKVSPHHNPGPIKRRSK